MKRCILILMLLLAAQAFAAPLITSPYDWMRADAQILAPTSFSPGVIAAGVTWTLIHHTTAFTCSFATGNATPSCPVTAPSTTGGNLLIAASGMFVDGPGGTVAYSAMTGDGTWTHCPSQLGAENYASIEWEIADCAYRLVATGGATSFSYAWSIPSGSTGGGAIDVDLFEFHKSAGAAVLETGNCSGGSGTNCFGLSGACSACTGPTPNVTGTDVVVVGNANENDCTSIASPFGTFDPDPSNVFGIFGWSLSQSSGNPAVYTCTSGGAAMFTVAFK